MATKGLRIRRLQGTKDDIHKNAEFLTKVFNNGFGEIADEELFKDGNLAVLWDIVGNITYNGLSKFFTEAFSSKAKAVEEIRMAKGFGANLQPNSLERLNRKRRFECIVLEDENNQIVGSVTTAKTDPDPIPFPILWKANDDQFYLSNLAIAKHLRRKGVARCLLRATETLATRWGCDSIWLHVEEKNKPAIQLYQNDGYVPRGKDPFWSLTNRILFVKNLR